jgi:hypothetical protein
MLLSAGTIATAKTSIALAGAALGAYEIGLARAGRGAERRAQRRGAWIALAVTALLVWARPGPLGGTELHVWELYHHVLGAKYFSELGYVGLYDCTLAADVEAGFEFPPAVRPVRRLATGEVEKGDRVLGDATACKRRFTAARWRAFAHDVGVFRAMVPPRRWGSILTDHGFNASPAWTITGAALARVIPVSRGTLFLFTLPDQILLAAMTVAFAWGFGLRAAAIAWIAIGTLYPSDFHWIGAAFLRYDWLALSAIGVALVRRGWLLAGAFALTWATAVRVFPGFLVAAVVLHAGLDLLRRRSLFLSAAHRRFALGCLLGLGAFGALSVAVAGRDAWPDFVAHSRQYLDTPLLNFMGWKTAVAFDPATTSGTLRDATQSDPFAPWEEAVHRNFERRRALYVAGIVAFTGLLATALRRTPLAWAPLLGVGLVVVGAELTCYYYALLALYAGLSEPIPAAGVLLLLFCAASQGIASAVTGSEDVVYAALSAASVLLALLTTTLPLHRSFAPAGGSGRSEREPAEPVRDVEVRRVGEGR